MFFLNTVILPFFINNLIKSTSAQCRGNGSECQNAPKLEPQKQKFSRGGMPPPPPSYDGHCPPTHSICQSHQPPYYKTSSYTPEGEQSNFKHTKSIEAELSTHHIGIWYSPEVITHGAPGMVVANLNSAFISRSPTTKSDVTTHTH